MGCGSAFHSETRTHTTQLSLRFSSNRVGNYGSSMRTRYLAIVNARKLRLVLNEEKNELYNVADPDFFYFALNF